MMEPTPTDTDLLHQLRLGEESAFTLLYKRYASPLLHYTATRIPREDAEEIVQEVFVSLWARRESLRAEVEVKPYLFASVKYMIIRYMQKQKVKQKHAEHVRAFAELYESVKEEHDLRDMHNVQLLLEKGLEELPERCRQAVRLRVFENLSNSEIAERMKISKPTVENYMVSAVKYLKGVWKKRFVVE
ncbi:MAG TPA: RNA polymerase sigma-70 factor [Ohtaekwangia sp.]